MKNLIHFLSLFLGTYSFSQSYWQQEVNYTLSVKLNDKNHTLSGFESFQYINHSPNTLDTIFIHIWPNAYRNGETALGKQLYKNNQTDLQFGNEDLKGYIDSLDFKVNGEKVRWEYDKKHIDICYLILNQPLGPGTALTVTTPFYVKIPSGEISRLGHIEQSYQITQWYPKPAVYDKNGWNAIPYLNQGEFYSEYGSYDVTITVPENYVVGATGDLQTASEIDFMNAKASETLKKLPEFTEIENEKRDPKLWKFPESSSTLKTIRFIQKNVHDFAWFADKRYLVLKGEIELPHSKRTVTSWALFTPQNAELWQHAIEYINDGTYYYSLWNGDYPYNQVTAVDGTISAGGGMEYPNVTVIGNVGSDQDLEIVIVHEVGHNWFYGILGSNERVHGWMDEGMNTLNEMRYMQTKYPDNSYLSNMLLGGAFHFNDLDHHDSGDFSYRLIAGLGEDEPIETHSADFSSINYGIIMYQKTGLVFHYLKDYLGDEKFNEVMRTYFDTWKFKHPQPEDMKKVCEEVTGEDLSWLFNDLIQTTNHIDYKITKVKKTVYGTAVTVKNKGQVSGPIGVDLISDNNIIESQWSPAYTKKTTLNFKTIIDFDWATIDSKHNIPEMNRANNNWHSKGILKKLEPIKMEFLIGDKESNKTNLFWTPVIAGNFYDKFMIGAAIHNLGIPFNKWQYLIAPMYSFGRNGISGIGELSYTVLPKYNFKSIRFGLSVKSFKEDSTSSEPKTHGAYFAYSPYIYAKLGKRENSAFNQFITLQGILKNTYVGFFNYNHKGAFLKYEAKLTYPDHQFGFEIRPEIVNGINTTMSRITASSTYRWKYLRNSMERWMELRLFAGIMNLQNYFPSFWDLGTYNMALSGGNGSQDLFFEDYYFGRQQMDGMWSQQRAENMGGFKSTSNLNSDNWMVTSNLLFQLPIPSFSILYAFADAGVFEDNLTSDTKYAINTGIALRISNVFGLYFPLWMSEDLKNSYSSTNYAERIRFTLKLNLVNKGSFVSSIFK